MSLTGRTLALCSVLDNNEYVLAVQADHHLAKCFRDNDEVTIARGDAVQRCGLKGRAHH